MPARSLSTHSAHSAKRGSSAGNSPIARRTGTKQSEDDEQIAGELMGEWLTGLPPTMPFHRGQVLIIPQSPYIHAKKSKGRTVLKTRTDMIQLESEDEAKSKKAGGDSVSHKKTSGDVNEEAAEEQEAGEKTAVKERFIYVSPAEKQIQRECSELHDVLQHSQARIVAEKTRRHRFLDSDRMSRSDLLAAKHAAFMERKRKAESKESAALAAMNTPRATSNYEMMVHSADEQPSGDVVQIKPQGKLMTPRPPEGITPRPPTGPRLIRPASNHGAGTGVGAEESPHHARLRHLPEPCENVPLPPTSARRSDAEDPEFSMSRDKSILKKPGTSSSSHHTHWGQMNGAETERIISPAKSDAVWSEPGNGKVSLENFEQYPGKRINSPHSVVAMKRFGVVQEDLERRPDSYYESITAAQLRGPRPASSRQDTSAEEQSRIAHMRLDFDERSRKRLLEKLITERRRHLNAQAVLIMENTYGEPPAPELKAFGHAARANYLEGPSENGQRKQVRGVMTYVDEMASALIEKGRSKVLRNQVMERKRMQAMLKSHIKSKDHIEDLQEKLGEKVGNKAVFMAERQQKIAMDREQKARRSLERQSDTYGNANQNYAEKMRYLNEKMERAAQTSQEANNRVRRRLQDTALLQAMKHELHQQRVLQAARAADYQRDVGEEKAARAQRNYDKLSEKREQISQEHLALKHQLLTERRFISAMVEGFEQTGEFRKISNAPDLSEIIGDILEIDATEMQVCDEDRNKDAQELTRNQWCKGNVRKGSYTYFKFKHACSRAPNRINIFLKTTKGDPDMYIGNHLVPYPCKDDFVWKVATFGDDKCTIHPFDKGFVLGYLYVGVYGYCDSEFSIKVRWNEAGDAAAPHMPGRQRSISEENSFESLRSLKSRQQNQFKRQASAERNAEISEAEENNKTKGFDVASFDWSVLCAWLRMIDVDEAAVQVVEKEKVPGAQLAKMSLDELISDLGMSKLQAKRVMMHTSGLVPSHSLSSHSLNSANSNTQVSAQNSLEKDVTQAETKPAEDPAPSAHAGEWDPLLAENGEGALGNVDDVKDA